MNSLCDNQAECGGAMLCEARKCVCNPDQHIEETTDVFERRIEKCVNNGMSDNCVFF